MDNCLVSTTVDTGMANRLGTLCAFVCVWLESDKMKVTVTK